MVAIRDLKCSMDIAEMAALGKFEQEFIVHGCCYVEDEQIFYKISSQEDDIYTFIDQCLENSIYPSPAQQLLNRTLVPSGMQDEYMYRTKIMLAKQMQQQYPAELLQKFIALVTLDGNDSAAELFHQIKKQPIGCFDREILQLVQGLLLYAFHQKKLKQQTYDKFQQWLEYLYSQMEDDVVIRKNVQRIFYGFAYKNGQKKISYCVNAKKSEVRKRQETLRYNGVLSTPIVYKTYFYDEQPNLRMVKDQFQQQLEQWFVDEYWQVLEEINRLPVIMDCSQLQKIITQAKQMEKNAMVQYVQYYGYLWNLFDNQPTP